MDNLSKNEELKQAKAQGEPTLCKNCFEFYGDSSNEDLCSKCHREKNAPLPKTEQTFSNCSIEEESKKDENEEKVVPPIVEVKQVDKNKCWSCQRKTGLLGYQCKCQFTFCKMHRLPEYHECAYDFASEGKKKLLEANPVVKGSKLEKI